MTRGFCIHAYNNLELDYGTMALCCALLIKKNLKTNNTALITTIDTINEVKKLHGESILNKAFDNINIIDIERNVSLRNYHDTRYSSKEQPYYNLNRSDTFELSPFDETILLDADYLVLDNSFDIVWGSIEDVMVNKVVHDLRHKLNVAGFDLRFNDMSIPLYWATAMYFRKTQRCESIFQLMKFIKGNYRYYQSLYRFNPSGYFRNDYALSIALHMISGQFENDSVKSLPINHILVATEHDDMINFKNNEAYFISEPEQGDFALHKVMTNIHVMNKWSIGRNAERIITYATN